MAFQAPAHGQWAASFGYRHGFNIAMAITANLLHRLTLLENKALDMAFMGEIHKVRQVVDFLPGYGFALLPVTTQLLNTFLVGSNITMTAHALGQRGNACYRTAAGVAMAIQAVDGIAIILYCSAMNVMGEFYGLYGCVGLSLYIMATEKP